MPTPSRVVSSAKDRVILALDVPTEKAALALVDELGDQISFYKIGLELLMAGALEGLLRRLDQKKKLFVDLKLPSDVPTTVERVVRLATEFGVKFLTLSASASPQTIEAAKRGRGSSEEPELLYVPFLSSEDRDDLGQGEGRSADDFEKMFEAKTAAAKRHGVDGFIVSGQEIALLRRLYPEAPLVSPGIRPSWATADDHKRVCTPAEAIQLGADYLVIGRPIRDAEDRKEAARRIIDEIAEALIRPPQGASVTILKSY